MKIILIIMAFILCDAKSLANWQIVFERTDIDIQDSFDFVSYNLSSYDEDIYLVSSLSGYLSIAKSSDEGSNWEHIINKYADKGEEPFPEMTIRTTNTYDRYIWIGYSSGADYLSYFSMTDGTLGEVELDDSWGVWNIGVFGENVITEDGFKIYLGNRLSGNSRIIDSENESRLLFSTAINDEYLCTSDSDDGENYISNIKLNEVNNGSWKTTRTPKNILFRSLVHNDNNFLCSGNDKFANEYTSHYIYRYLPEQNLFTKHLEMNEPGFSLKKIKHVNDDVYIALGTGIGYYISFDNGDNWYRSNYMDINSEAVDATIVNNDIYVAFQNGTVWKQDYLTTVEEDQDNSSKTVDDILYYDLVGKQLDPELIPTGQYYIKHTRYTDGSVSTDKLIKWE